MMDIAAGLALSALMVSPAILFALAIAAVAYAKRTRKPKASVGLLVAYTIGYALLMSVLVVGFIIWSMTRYETETGYSAGNAPAGLVFLLPMAVAFGQCVALLHWWFGRPG